MGHFLLDILHLDVSVLFVAHIAYLLQSSMRLFVSLPRCNERIFVLKSARSTSGGEHRALRLSDRLVIFYHDELCFVSFVLNREDLTWTKIDRLPHFVQQC